MNKGNQNEALGKNERKMLGRILVMNNECKTTF